MTNVSDRDRPIPPPRRTNRNVWILYVLTALLILVVTLGGPLLWHRSTQSDQRARRAVDVAEANQQALKSANACIRVSCGVPIPTPSAAPVPRGERGPGPTAAQIDSAVATYCAVHEGCTGTPSQMQVAEAVRAFCTASACRGRTGSTGRSGASGEPGPAGPSGAAGSGPTDDQVSAAVTAYCAAHGDCTGPAGPKGDAGDQGAQGASGTDGRGVASLDCDGLGLVGASITVHWTDGTVTTVTCNDTTTPTPSGGTSS